MDNFVKYLDRINAIAERFSRMWGGKFSPDELVNVSWIGYDKAIINTPSLAHESKKKTHFLQKIKCLMIDYIRHETKSRLQDRLIERDLTVPTFAPGMGDFIGGSLDSCESVDTQDLFDKLCNQVLLEDVDWFIIQSYFYDNKLLTEIGTELDLTESGVHIRKSKALEKLRRAAVRMSS